jgi:5-methylthioadenosine/S-adenosylhomocysteine deaminase
MPMDANGAMLLRGGTVVPMTDRGAFDDADVLLAGGTVAQVGRRLDPPDGAQVLDVSGCLVLPGFVQAHVHVVQSLARHRAEGLALLAWLSRRIWPYEAALGGDEVAAAARLGIAELLCGGTTAVMDMGTAHHQDRVFEAADELGIRMASGKCHMDSGEGVPAGLIEECDASLAAAEELGTRWHGGAGGRLRYAVAPRFVLSCSDELLAGAVELARRNGWLLHTHASENERETELVRSRTGRGNVAALAEAGFAGEDTIVAHAVHLDDDEFELLAGTRTGVAHCPGANLKLASGIADVPRMLANGIRVGIGADGPPCNNRLSVFHEMSLAGTLHNLRSGAGAVDAWTVLELATWRGAEAIGLGGSAGRLSPGYRADVVVLEPESFSMEPEGDPAAMIVHGASDRDVRDVIVDGAVVVRDRTLATADAAGIRAAARAAAAEVERRLGWS